MPTCHEKRATLSQNCENAFFGKRRSHARDSRESDHSNVKSAPKTDRPDRYDILLECRSYYLAQLAALLRDCQLVSEAAIAAILQGTGKHFDDMQVSRRLGSFSEEARGLTSSRISLVGDDDLELNIRLDGLCNRLAESTSVPLWKTHLRFITLLDRPDLPKTHNPVGPQGIIQGLQTLFKAAGATTLDDKLDLLDRIEIVLGEGLPAIYTQIDGLLDRAGAATAQASIVSAQEAPRPATAKPAASLPTTTGNAAPSSAGNESLLARLAATAGGGTGIATGAQLLSQVALDNLMFRLEQLERTQRNDSDFLTASSPNLEALIPELFADSPKPAAAAARPVRARELGIPGNTSEGQAIDAVGAFCDAIFADPELPEALKLLIASLQVSLVKLAIKDRSLFTRNDHPARGTIDRLGRAFLGQTATQHPQQQRLAATVQRLRGDFDGSSAAFVAASEELDRLLEERHAQITTQAAAWLPLLQQVERRDEAARDIQQLLGRGELDELPAVLQTFLRQDWKRLLEQAWFADGRNGPAWQARVEALGRLLWTFQPKADGEQRMALARQLPGVLKTLKEDMEQLGLAAETQTRILDACFELQTRAMRPPGPGEQLPSAASSAVADRREVVQGRVESGTLILHTLDFALPPAGGQRDTLRAGDWIELNLDGLRQSLCLCRQSPRSGRWLLFRPDPVLAVAIPPQLLEHCLKHGEAARPALAALCERALARALASAAR